MPGKKFKLMCLVWPDDKPDEHIIEVRIGDGDSVATLKDMIREKHLDIFDPQFSSRHIVLWKCSGLPDDDNLEQTLKSLQFDGSDNRLIRVTNARKEISKIFEDINLSKEPIHILVEVSMHSYFKCLMSQNVEIRDQGWKIEEAEDEKLDKLTELVKITCKNYETSLEKIIRSAPPSTSSKSGGYIIFQKSSDPIYDGRYVSANPVETRAPPIQIYHPEFGHFLDDFANDSLDVPDEFVRATALFMFVASGIYPNEGARKIAMLPKLSELLSFGIETVINLDSSSPDGIIITQALEIGESAALGIKEGKNEFGDGGSDPSTQAGLSYGRYWAQKTHVKARDNSCCPSFLLAIAGASIAILGAVWTDKIIVQRLTDYIWFGHGTIFNDKAIYRNARILRALSRSLVKLDNFYRSLEISSHPANEKGLGPRYFPFVNAYRGSDGGIINFKFSVPFESDSLCTTFLATTDAPPERIVVKFVHRYNKEAHELLAAKRMAPNLRYCGKIGVCDSDPSYNHLGMVVMDFVDGETVEKKKTFPSMVAKKIRKNIGDILTVLHNSDYVFGDLRAPNVMITKNNKVMFIDFDMVGEHGKSKYPIIMSPNIQWADGVHGLGIMLKEHDMGMFKQLVADYFS